MATVAGDMEIRYCEWDAIDYDLSETSVSDDE